LTPLSAGPARLFAGLLTLGLASPALGLESGPSFDHLTVEDGLAHNHVIAVLKDSRGFIWFGTQNGLSRYDGNGFTNYRHDANDPGSLPSPVVGPLFEDSQKRLWLGTDWGNAGLALYDREHDRFKRYAVPPRTGEVTNAVRAIAEDRQGRLWLGTGRGVAPFDPAAGTINPIPVPVEGGAAPSSAVMALLIDRQNRMWVGTAAGLLRFDPQSGRYTRWAPRAGAPEGLAHATITDIREDSDGQLWIAANEDGLHRVNPETEEDAAYRSDPRNPAGLSPGRVLRAVADGQGRAYVAVENHGLNILDIRSGRFSHSQADPDDEHSLNSDSIWALRFDDQGILWIGTYSGGVNLISPLGQRFQWIKARRGGLSNPHVSAILEDHRGQLWIGTDPGGLNRLDRKSGVFTYYRNDPTNPATIGANAVNALLEDREHNLWVGGWDGGVGRLDPVTGRVTRYRHDARDPWSLLSNDVWSIVELRGGELLVATQAGADFFDRHTGKFSRLATRYPEAGSGAIYAAAEDARGSLWLAFWDRVVRVDRALGRVTLYTHDPRDSSSLSPGLVQALLADSAGNVWVGTEGGLSCLAAQGAKLRRFTTADGLPHNSVASILEDAAGNLWLGTSRGLCQMPHATQLPDQSEILTFDVHDGVQGSEFARGAAFRARSGELFFGGSRGLNAFLPDRIRRNAMPPPIVLTDLKLFNRSMRPSFPGSPLAALIENTDTLTLSHRHSVVTFEFAALNYLLPQKNRYAYKLEGFDLDWNQVGGQHSATYTNLSPGRYVFKVRAANNDGIWNEKGIALPIRVTPPLWATWPFRLALAGLIAGALVQAYRRRAQSIEARRQEAVRRYHAVLDERTRLARELHDTLEQGLAAIRLQLGVVARRLHGAPGQAEQDLDLARRMLGHCIEEARRCVSDLRAGALEDADLVGALEEQARQMSADSAVRAQVRVSGVPRRLEPSVEHHLLRIGQEAMTNAVKHSGGDALEIEISYEEALTRLVVRDNGRGLPVVPEANDRHFGLQGIRERVARLGGSLQLGGHAGGGLEISVSVPRAAEQRAAP
jgi:ligand-binding sensor domain-containing protein/signal transduction histidine kinase